MSEGRNEPDHLRELSLTLSGAELGDFAAMLRALGSDKRLAILEFLGMRTYSVLELANAFGWPPSTVTLHVNILEHAQLIHTEIRPAKRGLQKVCSRAYDRITIQIPLENSNRAAGSPAPTDATVLTDGPAGETGPSAPFEGETRRKGGVERPRKVHQ